MMVNVFKVVFGANSGQWAVEEIFESYGGMEIQFNYFDNLQDAGAYAFKLQDQGAVLNIKWEG